MAEKSLAEEGKKSYEEIEISGKIVDEKDSPIYDAEIILEAIDERIEKPFKDLAFSNEEGLYKIYEALSGKHKISVSCEGFIDESKIININVDEKEKVIDFTLSKRPVCSISGKVLCSDKKTPYDEGLLVYATDKEGKVYSSFSDENGKFLIEDVPYGKSYEVAVVSKANILATKSLIIKEEIDVQYVDFIIEARSEIYGVVLVQDQSETSPLAEETIIINNKDNNYTASDLSDKDGKFHFYRVPYGSYTLTVLPTKLKGENNWTKFKQIENIQINNSKDRYELNILLEKR